MTKYLLLGLGLALASCATQKALPQYTESEKAAQRGGISWWQTDPAPTKADSTSGPRIEPNSQADLIRAIFEGHPPVVQLEVEAEPGTLPFVEVPKPARRLFGLLPAKKPASASAALGKCKGCTFNVAYGNQTNSVTGKKGNSATGDGATATAIDKVKAPTALGDSASATDNTKQGQRGGAGASGKNAKAEATTVKPKFPWAAVIGGVFCFGFLVWMIFLGGGGMLAVPLVRRKSDNQL
jgi:hypothetical protein